MYLTTVRIGEAVLLTKDQFYFETEKDMGLIIIRNIPTLKMQKAKIRLPYRSEFPIPTRGRLAPLTEMVVEHLDQIGEHDRLYPFSPHRGWEIVRHLTGKWCHYFRSQGESWYGRIYDVFGLKEFVKVTSIETLGDYVQAPWRQYRNKLLGK